MLQADTDFFGDQSLEPIVWHFRKSTQSIDQLYDNVEKISCDLRF